VPDQYVEVLTLWKIMYIEVLTSRSWVLEKPAVAQLQGDFSK
jgi:hypothetical protein